MIYVREGEGPDDQDLYKSFVPSKSDERVVILDIYRQRYEQIMKMKPTRKRDRLLAELMTTY
jgi:hypothetical protein